MGQSGVSKCVVPSWPLSESPAQLVKNRKSSRFLGLQNQNLWGGALEATYLNRFPDDCDSDEVRGPMGHRHAFLHSLDHRPSLS